MAHMQLWFLGSILMLIGLALSAGGAWLVAIGGSLYYLPAGIACVVSGGLIISKRKAGVWIYAALVIVTFAWALWEVGLHFWLMLPRVSGPLVLLIYMLTPWFQRAIDKRTGTHYDARTLTWVGGALSVLAVSVLLAASARGLFADKDSKQGVRAAPLYSEGRISDWSEYAGSKAGLRYSPAALVKPQNVGELKEAWVFRTGDLPEKHPASLSPQMFETTPLQIGDTLYLCSPRNIVIALDADTGKERWRYDPKVDDKGVYTMTCRGVAYHEAPEHSAVDCQRRVLTATVDGRMTALNADNGHLCKDFGGSGEISLRKGLGNVLPGFHFNTSPPMVVGNVVIVGGFVLDNMTTDAPSGVVRAFDVLSGRLLWSWDAGLPDPNAVRGDLGGYARGSPNVWSLMSADEKLGLVYLPTGNPSPDHFGGQRSPEMERYGSSVVALEANTGKLRWSFQTVHHDLWDYDVPSQPVLIDIPINGRSVPALILGTKQGELFLLDRRSGKSLGPVKEIRAPSGKVVGERYSPTQPVSLALPSLNPPPLRESDMWGATPLDQLWCRIAFRRLHYQGRFTPPSLDNGLIFPGNNGIMNWGSLAVDPERQILIVPTSYMPMTLKLIPRAKAPATNQIAIEGRGAISPMLGTPYAVQTERPFGSPLGIPCNAPPWGRLTAIDLKTRTILWQRPLGTTSDHAPLGIAVPGVFNQGGAIVTSSGLVFIAASLDNYLRAFDVETGRELWKGRLPAGGQALPMTYVSPRTGKQYVVIAAGGHAFMKTKIGDFVVAYNLPEH